MNTTKSFFLFFILLSSLFCNASCDRFIRQKPGPQKGEDFGSYGALLRENEKTAAARHQDERELPRALEKIRNMVSKNSPAKTFHTVEEAANRDRSSYQILDAPNVKTNTDLNLIEWDNDKENPSLAVALNDTIYVYQLKNKKIISLVTLSSGYVSAFKWHSFQKGLLAFGTSEGVVEIWRLIRKANEEIELKRYRILRGNTTGQPITALSWNGRILSAGGANGKIVHYNISLNEAIVGESQYHKGIISSLAWHTVENILVSASSGPSDHTIALWDMKEFCREQKKKSFQNEEKDAPKKPKKIFNSPRVFKGHTDGVLALAWGPGSSHVFVSGSADKTIKLWNTVSKNPLKKSLDVGEEVTALLFDEKNYLMATAGKQLFVWNTSWNEFYKSEELDGIFFLTLTKPAGTNFVTTLGSNETIRFFQPYAKQLREKRKLNQIGGAHQGTLLKYASRLCIR